jgi:PAS domain S-box-containing protein
MIGHYLKLAAFIGLYMAILFPGANNPISLLMRDLEESRARAVREQTLAKQYLDIAGVMIIAYRPDGTIMLANNKAGAILGVDKHELVGKNWFMEFIPSSLQDELRYVFYELTEGNPAKVQYRENPVMSKDGTVRHIAWYNEVLRDDDGGIVGIISSGEDITARKRAEEEIYYHLRLEEVVSTLSRTLMRPVEEIDLDAALKSIGEVTNVDRAYIFLYDYQTGTMSNTHEWAAAGVEPEKDNLQGLRFEDFTWWNDKLDEQSYINEHDVSAIEDLNVRGVLEAQRIRSLLVIELMQDDGPRIGFMGFDSLRHKVWRPEDIRLIRMLAETISLYFKRARDQDLLLASERRFRGLVQKSSEITMLVDREGIIAYCSPSIAEILGYAAEEVLGTPYSDLCCGEVELPVARGLEEQGSFVTYETQMKKKDGRSADFEIRASNLLEDKDIGGIVINARDITKRRQAQRERERAIAELKERNRELEEFTRQLYHDLQTPLVTIGSYSDEVIKKLGDGQDPSSARLDAYVIRNAARQLSAFATELAIKIRIRK